MIKHIPYTRLLLCLPLLLSLCLPFSALAAPGEAILVVAFGTSVEKARVAYANVEEGIRRAYPDADIRWAWSARSLLKSAPGGAPMLSPQEALARLGTEGVKKVTVLSLHIIPGQEYTGIARTAKAFEGLPKGIESVRMCPPLLSDTTSLAAVADILLQSLPAERTPDDAVIFVGHGTHHPAGVYYPALNYYLQARDAKAFVGTIEGDLSVESIGAALKAAGVKKAWLAPLMTVAGDHAMNDLFGNGNDSWKSALAKLGLTVAVIDKGLGENPAIVAHWLKALEQDAGVNTP